MPSIGAPSDSKRDRMGNGTYLIAGLGNPGDEYAQTRHNAGFRVVDILAERLGANYWKSECGSVVAHASAGEADALLAKPLSFMNLSGGPIRQLMAKHGIDAGHLIVVHDELDIPSGTIRVKHGGGHGGHNGIRSIIDKAQTRDFARVRIGLGRPPGRMDSADYVLRAPKGDALADLEVAEQLGADAVLSILEVGVQRTQGKFN